MWEWMTSHGHAEEGNEAKESTEGKLFYKFSETRVPPVVRQVLESKGWYEWDPDLHSETLWSLHWKSGRFKLSDWDRYACLLLLMQCHRLPLPKVAMIQTTLSFSVIKRVCLTMYDNEGC